MGIRQVGADNSLSVDSLLVLKCVYMIDSITLYLIFYIYLYICKLYYKFYTLQEGCGIIIVTKLRGHILLHA